MEIPPLRKVVLGAIEHSFYEHFCAGKDLNEAYRTVRNLRDAGLGAMLDYGMEHANDSESCDKNLAEFVQTIESTKLHPTSPVSTSFLLMNCSIARMLGDSFTNQAYQ